MRLVHTHTHTLWRPLSRPKDGAMVFSLSLCVSPPAAPVTPTEKGLSASAPSALVNTHTLATRRPTRARRGTCVRAPRLPRPSPHEACLRAALGPALLSLLSAQARLHCQLHYRGRGAPHRSPRQLVELFPGLILD